jgi:hypothetical protein
LGQVMQKARLERNAITKPQLWGVWGLSGHGMGLSATPLLNLRSGECGDGPSGYGTGCVRILLNLSCGDLVGTFRMWHGLWKGLLNLSCGDLVGTFRIWHGLWEGLLNLTCGELGPSGYGTDCGKDLIFDWGCPMVDGYKFVQSSFPYFDRSHGVDHVWTFTHDHGCVLVLPALTHDT